MIYSLSTKISESLTSLGYVDSDETETVAYGFFTMLSKIIYAVTAFTVGAFVGRLPESMVFYFSVLFVRKYAGGFHADTEARCFAVSSLSIVCSIFLTALSCSYTEAAAVLAVLSTVSAVIVVLLAPVPAIEKPLDEKETLRFRRNARIRLGILWAAGAAVSFTEYKSFGYAALTAISLVGIFLAIGKIKIGLVLNHNT